MKKHFSSLHVWCFCFVRAVHISIPLTEPVRPLREITLEGKGSDRIFIMDISGTINS
jgi:hypothetical protein